MKPFNNPDELKSFCHSKKCKDCEYWIPVCNELNWFNKMWTEMVGKEIFTGILSHNRKQKLAKLLSQ